MKHAQQLLLVCLLAGALLLVGCTTTLRGTVVSGTSGAPVAGAQVRVSGKSAVSDSGGSFVITGLPRGKASGSIETSGMSSTSFVIDLAGGDASETLKISDSRLAIKVIEAAIEPKEVTGYVVTLDDVEVEKATTLTGLAPGRHTLKISAKDHETRTLTTDLKPGDNSVVATIALTPSETYRRFSSAAQYGRTDVSYQYIHPDERALLSLAAWRKWGAGTTDKSITYGEVRTLASWTSPVTKKAYSNVAETDRTIEFQVTDPKYSDYGRIYTDNFSQHWAKVGDVWYLLHTKLP
jgi:hypothetical protein